MEKLRSAVKVIAYTPQSKFLSPFHLSLIPLLSVASSLYSIAIRLRRHLYRFNILHSHRLPVPVISVGNLTWGGNGKTPMVELLARSFADAGISPLILTRGYCGADEAKMLKRQLQGTCAKIGVGANRVATAVRFLDQYGFTSSRAGFEQLFCGNKIEVQSSNNKIGVAILDDGMQHLSVQRDLEIVMVNALMPWGNHCLLPLGPLREPLTALCRADILVIHHADLVKEKDIDALKSTIRKGIGYADSFIQRIERMGPTFVDHLDFSDHHLFELQDLQIVCTRLEALELKFGAKPIVVVTEKDYDRAPEVLLRLKHYEVLVLCSRLQFLDYMGSTEERFRKTVVEYLSQR
ncbi:probable tetraacyldisaccharide 4'-kinase, mitochondrial isoform X2 [Salvia hispanica]|uniref:probable tetraacyldisaccharide 4'-kinase, mitochondrial isoform X2 n=1 Tax=Salvia hispanica TaxID=49212 RepID=UPI002009C2CE|nr:probable tetraacyldisaccharide 4'-kinase, mitochondrial isoform X2 [Salvia hispanica]